LQLYKQEETGKEKCQRPDDWPKGIRNGIFDRNIALHLKIIFYI